MATSAIKIENTAMTTFGTTICVYGTRRTFLSTNSLRFHLVGLVQASAQCYSIRGGGAGAKESEPQIVVFLGSTFCKKREKQFL